MSKLLRLLCAYLTLGVNPGDADDPPEPETAETETIDDILETVDPVETAPADDEPPAVKAANRRAQENAERADRAEAALREAEARQAARPAVDTDAQAEADEISRAKAGGATENDIVWIKWRQEQQREMRQLKRQSQEAFTASQDLADRTAFDRLEVTKPALYKRYGPRIEKIIADNRAQGKPSPPRMMILNYLYGEDAVGGKITKTKPKTDAAPAARVDRGRLPPARGDVRTNGKGDSSESAKRRARLENQLI